MEERISTSLNLFPEEIKELFYMSRKISDTNILQEYLCLAWFEYLIFYFPERVDDAIITLNRLDYSWMNKIQTILHSRDCNELDNFSVKQNFCDSLNSFNLSRRKRMPEQLLNLSNLFKFKIIKIKQNDDLMISAHGNPTSPSLFLFIDHRGNYFILYPFYDKITLLGRWIYEIKNSSRPKIDCICIIKNYSSCNCRQLIQALSYNSAISGEKQKQNFSELKPTEQKLWRISEGDKQTFQNPVKSNALTFESSGLTYNKNDRLSNAPNKLFIKGSEINKNEANKDKLSEEHEEVKNNLIRKCTHRKQTFKSYCGCLLCRNCSHSYIINRVCGTCNDQFEAWERIDRVNAFLKLNQIGKIKCAVCKLVKEPSLQVYLLPYGCNICREPDCLKAHVGKCKFCKNSYKKPKY